MVRMACNKESCLDGAGATEPQHTLGRTAAPKTVMPRWAAGREGSPSHTGSLPLPNARVWGGSRLEAFQTRVLPATPSTVRDPVGTGQLPTP